MNEDKAAKNFIALAATSYTGRGIVLGESADARFVFQVYWISGRSENSRNRVFVRDADGTIRTEAYDKSKMQDPSLVIYNCARSHRTSRIVTNGDQTDTIVEALEKGGSFESGLRSRLYEPDAPNYTPRISAIADVPRGEYALAIVKTIDGDPAFHTHQFFRYAKLAPGYGFCLTTYSGDGNPLPSFGGEPYPVPMKGNAEELLDRFWEALDPQNRVALFVQSVEKATGTTSAVLRNRHV